MADYAETTTGGGLVVQNGRRAGTKLPLRLPVTVIGTGAGCDIRLTATGVKDIHCVIVATPLGLALRSLVPESTHLNGAPTAAALLHNDDELAVGPCVFRLAWTSTTLTEQQSTPAENFTNERGQDAHKREDQRVLHIEEREKRVQQLLDQLAAAREQLRQERAKILVERADTKKKADEARQLADARKKDRTRTRKAAARLLKRMRAKCFADLASARAEQTAAQEERMTLARERNTLAADRAALAADYERFRAEAEEYNSRLHEAWGMIADAQQRLASDRQQVELEYAHHYQQLEARSLALAEEEQKLAAERQAFDEHRQAMQDHIASLEQRATHLRAALDELERKRTVLAAVSAIDSSVVPEAIPIMDPVPLDWRDDRTADELMTLLQCREKELEQEHKFAAEKRAELERLAGELADQQAVLTEQRARFDAERRQWQSDEARAVAELETLARDLDAREQLLTAKLAVVDRTVAALKDREQELSRFQTKLERWQIALTNHEVRTAAERDQAKAALVAKQAELAERESNLAEVCRVWSEIRIREREALQIELTRWADERQQFNVALTALDRQRQELIADAGRVAALAVSLEESRQEWERIAGSPKAVRRLRVLRRRWESRFRRYSKELTRRQEMLTAETTALNDRYRSLHRLLTEVTEKRAELAAAEQSAELAKQTTPALPNDDGEPVILSLAEARRERSEEELRTIRADVERMAASIRRADDNAGLVRLCPAA